MGANRYGQGVLGGYFPSHAKHRFRKLFPLLHWLCLLVLTSVADAGQFGSGIATQIYSVSSQFHMINRQSHAAGCNSGIIALKACYYLYCYIPYSRDYKYPSIIRTPQIQVPI